MSSGEKSNTKSVPFVVRGINILLNVILYAPTKEKILFNWVNFFLQLEKNFSSVGE